MIVKPENMTFESKKFSMIIYGSPGIGKTTLALSAPSPVLIDFEHGISRVKAYHRKDTIVCTSYEEVQQDIHSPDMMAYETIIIDTGGSFVSYLKDWAMNLKGAKTKSGEFNGLKGFGFVKSEFNDFTEYVKNVLNKNVIYIFHCTEQADKDGNPTQRLMCEGSVRNTVWNPCDFGGYVQMIGNQRVICFTPEQEYFAKGCHGVEGQMVVPTLGPNDTNDFITRLFEKAKANIAAENDVFAPMKEQYDIVMQEVRTALDGITTLEEINEAVADFQNLDHALTSKKEASSLLNKKARELGFVFDKNAGGYVVKEK